MSVKVRPYRGTKDKYEVDIRIVWQDKSSYRERVLAPVSSRSGARRWGERRQQDLLTLGQLALDAKLEKKKKEENAVPTVQEFMQSYLDDHCRANRLKPATIVNKESILRVHIVPMLGEKKLDAVSTADVQRLKGALIERAPKTVNNVLATLSALLKAAKRAGIIDRMPCEIDLLRVHYEERPFYDFVDYERLVTAAEKVDARVHLVVLLGGEAGLRMGEIIALRWGNVLFDRRVVRVVESEWRGHLTVPKSGRGREVPMTTRLYRALLAHRHLRGQRVLVADDGTSIRARRVQRWMASVERIAGVDVGGRVHIFRHSFCSHLAIKGAPARAVQQLAGHADLTTTMRYMHLTPAARVSAIQLLDARPEDAKAATLAAMRDDQAPGFGEIVEKVSSKKETH